MQYIHTRWRMLIYSCMHVDGRNGIRVSMIFIIVFISCYIFKENCVCVCVCVCVCACVRACVCVIMATSSARHAIARRCISPVDRLSSTTWSRDCSLTTLMLRLGYDLPISCMYAYVYVCVRTCVCAHTYACAYACVNPQWQARKKEYEHRVEHQRIVATKLTVWH